MDSTDDSTNVQRRMPMKGMCVPAGTKVTGAGRQFLRPAVAQPDRHEQAGQGEGGEHRRDNADREA